MYNIKCLLNLFLLSYHVYVFNLSMSHELADNSNVCMYEGLSIRCFEFYLVILWPLA